MSGLDSIPVSRIMTSHVKTIKENETIQQACKAMVENNIGSIVVASQSNEPIGIITERDVVRHLAEKPISFAAPTSQVVSKPLITIHPNASIRDALQTMQARNIRRLGVTSDDGKQMVGIITDKDIFRFIARNESIASSFSSEEQLARGQGEMAERYNRSLLDDIFHRKP